MHADKDIQFVIEAAAVQLVEDLHPHEDVEDYGVELEFFVGDADVVLQDGPAGEVQDEDYYELEDGLSDYHFPHLID